MEGLALGSVGGVRVAGEEEVERLDGFVIAPDVDPSTVVTSGRLSL